mmetsp:Transcript_16498/g.23952  ORF Transcript_16498/g.23952 Transcript_16498/m.23952 type:complete len:112 (+) Transcript_16498:305-640(+)
MPNAHVETLKAPLTPRRLIERNTLTTKTFKGIPNKFMMTDLCESGTYLLLSVPMDGKYIPTHASNAKKEEIKAHNGIDADDAATAAPPIATVARVNIADVNVSAGTPNFAN